MRSQILYPLFADISTLQGVGKAIAAHLEKLKITKVVDVLFHHPTGVIDRSNSPEIPDIKDGDIVTIKIKVDEHIAPSKVRRLASKLPYKVSCSNSSGSLFLVFFNYHTDYLKKNLPVGETRIISGRAEHFDDVLQITHPEYILSEDEIDKLKKIEPVYPLTQNITLNKMHQIITGAINRLPDLPEWIDNSYLKKQSWQGWKDSVIALHNPKSRRDLEPLAKARARLAFDEILANQLALSLVRLRIKKKPGIIIKGDDELSKTLIELLPFKLTNSQNHSIAEIRADMQSGNRMVRLLQGDVGSGKTAVSLLAMLAAVESGKQAVLMAPTEILAKQHYNWIKSVSETLDINIAFLSGKIPPDEKAETQKRIETGDISIVIGTHALFQEKVAFKELALAVIDEQHRFGVDQRMALAAKGVGVHMLLLSATPIPRTLAMTAYGDMDISLLREKPAGRKPIDTRIKPLSRINEVITALQQAVGRGEKIYWICPLVSDSEKIDLAAAESRYKALQKVFGNKVGLVHGRMNHDEREQVMLRFAGGDLNILVATTVVEVGVDIRDATIMIIEHAERFGLSQLHQLRGRVGRGDKKSFCMLLYGQSAGANAIKRLQVIKATEDGFEIAEQDLKMRGYGDFLGTKQTGLPDFKVADYVHHNELFAAARDYTKIIIERDAELKTDQGKNLRNLLYLFEYDNQVKHLSQPMS